MGEEDSRGKVKLSLLWIKGKRRRGQVIMWSHVCSHLQAHIRYRNAESLDVLGDRSHFRQDKLDIEQNRM